MTEIIPRYEFRVWGDDLSAHRKKLEQVSQSKEASSEETYLISEATDRCNAKVRYGLMDIKVLVREDRGLEQWAPSLKAGFPLARAVIVEKVFPSLGLAPPRLDEQEYALEEFLGAVMRAEPQIAIVEVSKTRHRFNVGVCQAEYSAITFNRVPRDTVAVESTDADAVLQLVRELGITEPNTSYIREIKRVLGQAAL